MTAANLTRVAFLALTLSPTFAAGARADDEYGTGHERVVRGAAASVMVPMVAVPQPIAPERFAAGQNDNFGAPQRDALIRQFASRGSSAVPADVAQATTPGAGYTTDAGLRQTDLVGGGGRQDALARRIYRPGGATDF